MNQRSVVGLVMLLIGVAFGVVGFQRTKPTDLEKTMEFAAQLTGRQLPGELKRDRSDAYLLLTAGAGLIAVGAWLVVSQQRDA